MNVKSNCFYISLFLLLFSVNAAASNVFSVQQKYRGITAISIEGNYASVTVNVSRSRKVKLRSSAKISQAVLGSELKLSTAPVSRLDHVIVHSDSGVGSIIVINGVQISSGSAGSKTEWRSGSHRPTLELDVPAGTRISLDGFRGKASIGHIHAPFVFKGSGQVTVGNVTDAHAALRGNSSLTMARAAGVLVADLRGNSTMHIKRGQVRETRIKSSGNSHFTYNGWTDTLDVNSRGNSRVEIARTGYPPRIRQRGNAEVRVNM